MNFLFSISSEETYWECLKYINFFSVCVIINIHYKYSHLIVILYLILNYYWYWYCLLNKLFLSHHIVNITQYILIAQSLILIFLENIICEGFITDMK